NAGPRGTTLAGSHLLPRPLPRHRQPALPGAKNSAVRRLGATAECCVVAGDPSWAVAGLCAALMLAGVLTGLGTAGASAAGCPGKVVHLFDPGDQDNIFMGVAAVSACDIWEVGKS